MEVEDWKDDCCDSLDALYRDPSLLSGIGPEMESAAKELAFAVRKAAVDCQEE